MIANIARSCFPELYARRLKEMQEDGDNLNAVLPIFYCKPIFYCQVQGT